MTPGVAFFYGGMVRQKNVLSVMMQSFSSIMVVGVLWAIAGYTLAFAPGNPLIGGLQWLGLRGVWFSPYAAYAPGVPQLPQGPPDRVVRHGALLGQVAVQRGA